MEACLDNAFANESEVTYFEERADATFARVRVKNVDGLPAVYEREFVFVKNRFLATRETITFEESFKARVSPLWNTRNIGPQIGSHWANTFMGSMVASNGRIEMTGLLSASSLPPHDRPQPRRRQSKIPQRICGHGRSSRYPGRAR